MPRSTVILVGINEIVGKLQGKKFKSVHELLRQAMRLARNHWLVTEEYERFQLACGVGLILANPKDKDRIKKELDMWIALSNAIATGNLAPQQNLPRIKQIGLAKLWREIAEEEVS